MNTTELIAATAHLRERIGLRDEPIAFLYSDQEPEGFRPKQGAWACLVACLNRVRQGETLYFDQEHFGCGGGGYYLGLTQPSPTIDQFVSTGIPGKMKGERYKQSPELVRAMREAHAVQPAPAPYAVFKQVSKLAEDERPLVVACFGSADELSGLVFLANFARRGDAVLCVMSSGCGGLVTRPLSEAQSREPRAVLGMFDPSARPYVPADQLSFAAPVAMWEEMLANADESFLTTETWAKVRKRILSR